jgi:ribosomal-protein-alanine N-acetyltransferase
MLSLNAGPCIVRPWRVEDLDALIRHADNVKIARNLRDAFPHPYTREAGEFWLKLATTMDPVTSFAIECDGEAVGGIGLKLDTDIERVSAEIGYWLGESVWGRGLATAAVRALSEHAFDAFGLTRLFALPFAHNTASRRVLEKAGFTLEAILRKSAVKEGQIVDQALYGRIRE